MVMNVSYLVVNGEILSETRSGIESDYIPDPLGSAAELINSMQTITDTFTWWPYGQLRAHSGSSGTPFGYVGTMGYYGNANVGSIYVRARIYIPGLTRWTTVDSLWPSQPPYAVTHGNPVTWIDPSGNETLDAFRCRENTLEYQNACNKTGNKLDCCAAKVSAAICAAIIAGRTAANTPYDIVIGIANLDLNSDCMPSNLALGAQCQNNCMIKLWRKKTTPQWKNAIQVCAKYGQRSKQCCEASIQAEQNGYDRCAPICLPDLSEIPNFLRINFANKGLGCCN